MPTLSPAPGTMTYVGATPTVTRVFTLSPGPGQLQYTPQQAYISLVTTVGQGLMIGGTSYNWLANTARITKTLSAAWSASFQVLFGTNGASTKPTPGQEVAFFVDGTKRFGGLVMSTSETSIVSSFKQSFLTINCTGFQSYADRCIVAKLYTLDISGVVGITAFDIWQEHLAQFGVTHGPGDNPPVGMPQILFHYITATECFNQLKAQAPGWDWFIDDNKVFDFIQTSGGSGPAAPFTLRDTDHNVDTMTVTTNDSKYRNKQWVLPSIDVVGLRVDNRTGDGTRIAFPTLYAISSKPIVQVNGVAQIVVAFGFFTPGWQAYYIPNAFGIFFASAPAAAATIDISYPSPFPLAVSAQDDAAIAAKGLYETVTQAQNVQDVDTALEEAQGLLDLYGTDGDFPQEVQFTYNSFQQPAWLRPGMSVDVNRTFPTAVGFYTVESVDSLEQDLAVWRHSVTLRAGNGDVTDAQAIQEFRTSTRNPINGLPSRATALIGQDIPGQTNQGLSTGLISAIYVVPNLPGGGVLTISSWDGLMKNPPTGADLQADFLVNGVSIFPTGGANKMVIPDGSTAFVSGINFVSNNIKVNPGDQITMNIIQVGSTFGGANGVFHLNFVR